MTARVYLVGTDTGVGKTTLCCALLRAAAQDHLRALPFKPAVSGPPGSDDDPSRLQRAAGTELTVEELAPLRFPLPLAPGLADDPRYFLGGDDPRRPVVDDLLSRLDDDLRTRERERDLHLTLLEGAGGLEVPMPGGTWQPTWISRLRARPLVVAPDRLGTINHTLLTIAALRNYGLAPLGFALVELERDGDLSRALNAPVIEQRTGLPCLARLPHLPQGDPQIALARGSWHHVDLWSLLGL